MKKVSFVFDERSVTSDLGRISPHHKIKIRDKGGKTIKVVIVPKLTRLRLPR